jgi:hypothetical protein
MCNEEVQNIHDWDCVIFCYLYFLCLGSACLCVVRLRGVASAPEAVWCFVVIAFMQFLRGDCAVWCVWCAEYCIVLCVMSCVAWCATLRGVYEWRVCIFMARWMLSNILFSLSNKYSSFMCMFVSSVEPAEIDYVARCIVNIFAKTGFTLELINAMIYNEFRYFPLFILA